MREAIGGTWLFGVVIFFIILFSGYLAMSVNYSKAFQVKNEIVSIIERRQGMNDKAQEDIDNYLKSVGYGVFTSCKRICDRYANDAGFQGCVTIDPKYTNIRNQSETKFCVAKYNTEETHGRSYYRVTAFFRIDLPIFRQIFTFPVNGETKMFIPKG